MSSAVQKHVLDHVRQMVCEHAVLIDGVAFDPIRTYPLSGRFRDAFYVCPRTGLLRKSEAHVPRG